MRAGGSQAPLLRFPEFGEPWKTQPLKAVLQPKRKRNLSRAFGRQHVLSVAGDAGIKNQIEYLGRSYAGVDLEQYHVVDPNDVVYTKSPLKAAPYGIIKANFGPSGIVSTLYAVYTILGDNDPKFIDHYFALSDRLNAYLRPLVHIGAKNDMKISAERVLIDPVVFPEADEQRKIARFLDAVDDKIGLLTRKAEILQHQKRAVSERLFAGEIRFRCADGSEFPEWERIRLGDVATFAKGRNISKDDIAENGATPCVRYGELYTAYTEHIKNVISRTDVPANHLLLSKGGEVILPASGEMPLDMASASYVSQPGVALGGDINVIRSKLDGLFLAYMLRGPLRRAVGRLAQGNSVVHLYNSHLAGLTLYVPSDVEEQRRIAAYLSTLDDRIDGIRSKATAMRTFKKGLLQQMFV